jgi:hypothetical protein
MVYAINLEFISVECWFKSNRRHVLSTVSKNTATYCFLQNKKLFLLVISSSKGWSVTACRGPYFIIREKKVFFFLSHIKSFSGFMSIVFSGLQKGYFQYLKLRGMGYKFVNVSNYIVLKFGFSHRIVYVNPINTKCKFISKYFLRLETRCLWTIKKIVQSFNSIRKKNVYKKKGIFLKGCLISVQVSSKKSKF